MASNIDIELRVDWKRLGLGKKLDALNAAVNACFSEWAGQTTSDSEGNRVYVVEGITGDETAPFQLMDKCAELELAGTMRVRESNGRVWDVEFDGTHCCSYELREDFGPLDLAKSLSGLRNGLMAALKDIPDGVPARDVRWKVDSELGERINAILEEMLVRVPTTLNPPKTPAGRRKRSSMPIR